MIGGNMDLAQVIAQCASFIVKTAFFVALWIHFIPSAEKNDEKYNKDIVVLTVSMLCMEVIASHVDMKGLPFWIPEIYVILAIYCKVGKRKIMPEMTFLILLYANLRYLSYFIINSAIDVIYKQVLKGIEYRQDIDSVLAVSTRVMSFLTIVLFLIVMTGMVYAVMRTIKTPFHINWYECGYLSALNVAGIILTEIMISIAVIATEDGTFVLTEEKPELLWLMPIIAVLLYLGELSALYFWQNYMTYRRQSEIYYVEKVEKEAIQRRLSEMESYYDQVRKVRHEMANHMTNIRGLANTGNTEEIRKYITELDEQIRPTKMRYATGNPITDVVINDQYRKADEKGISFSIAFAFDEMWGIPAMDLSVVLSNLLNNAIEAADEVQDDRRYVSLRTLDKDGVIMIRCQNGYDNDSKKSKDSNYDMWHGIGLKNVSDIANRFDGTVNIKRENDMFSIAVLMKKRPSVTEK